MDPLGGLEEHDSDRNFEDSAMDTTLNTSGSVVVGDSEDETQILAKTKYSLFLRSPVRGQNLSLDHVLALCGSDSAMEMLVTEDDNTGAGPATTTESELEDDEAGPLLSTEQVQGIQKVTTSFHEGGITATDFATSVLEGISALKETPGEIFTRSSLESEVEKALAETTRYNRCGVDDRNEPSTSRGSPRPSTPPSNTEPEHDTPPYSPLKPFSLLDFLIPPRTSRKRPRPLDISDERMQTFAGSPAAGTLVNCRSPESMRSTPNPVRGSNALFADLIDDEANAMIQRVIPQPGFYSSGDTPTEVVLQRRRKLPATYRNLVGQAHVEFARGNHDAAIEICLEVIKEEPMCPEPYSTLAMIYENSGRNRESLQFALIGALLSPKACNEWPRLGDLCLKYQMTEMAIRCFTNGLVVDRKDADMHLKRCSLLEGIGDIRGALRGYAKMLNLFRDRGSLCVQVLRRIAKIHHSNFDQQRAYESLKEAMDNFRKYITVTESNLMLELCVSMKKYVEAAQVLVNFSRVKFVPELSAQCFRSRNSLSAALKSGRYTCFPPSAFNVDLEAKLIIVLVHLEAFKITNKLSLDMIRSRDVETYGDLFLEIAEAYMAKRRFKFPLRFLQPLVYSEKFSQAAVWLRYAECLFLVGHHEEAAVAYKRVVTLAPSHNLAKLNLSIILQKLGRDLDAFETLTQDKDDDAIDHDFLMEKCNIYYKRREYFQLMDSVMLLLCRFSVIIQNMNEAMVIVMSSNFTKRVAAIQYFRKSRGSPPDNKPAFMMKDVKPEREWKMYLKLCHLLMEMERWDLLSRVTYTACASTLFSKYAGMEKEAESHCFFASARCNDPELLPQQVRIFLSRYDGSPLALNVFCVIMKLSEHSRYTKHILRLLHRLPNDFRLMLLNAHLSFVTGSYKNALMEYMSLYTLMPEEPLIPLMISCTLLHVLTQKMTRGRAKLANNVLAFARRYMEMRGHCQEVYYNLGRTFQFMGRKNLAAEYYNRVFDTDPISLYEEGVGLDDEDYIPDANEFEQEEDVLDLRCEAAYNLAHMHRSTGARDIARNILLNNIII